MAARNKQYAVVKFLSDCTFSEIPTAWLMTEEDDNQQCWWPPRTANSKLLIANCASPNYDTWIRYDVDIIKYCTSLESARKSAADATYYTTDEERLGRGHRQHVSYNRFSTEEEGYDYSQTRKHNISKKHPNTNTIVSALPSCPDNFGSNKTTDALQVNGISECNHITTYHHENENNATLQRSEDRTLRRSEDQFLKPDEIPIIIEGYTSLAQNVEQDLNIKQNIKQMLRMQAATNILLKDLKQRIIKVEDVIKNGALHLPESNNLIAQFLPLNTIKDVKEFESVLKTTDEAVTQFRELVSKTGGNNPKHTIQRTMKKIFTNECAMKCSWKGIKNNFRVCDLHLIKIMRNVTLQHMNLTESEFDNIVAEWLRFARQRKQREDKEKENERHNENEEDQRINE